MNPINTTPPSSSSVWSRFLKDVFICSLGAYGGPEAHFGVFTDQLVQKKKYLTEEELAELIALTGILPGPSSTQTIVAIGYKTGGPILAFLTFLVWALPVLSIMTLLSYYNEFTLTSNAARIPEWRRSVATEAFRNRRAGVARLPSLLSSRFRL